MSSSPPAIIYLGMDVHKDSIAIAVLPESAKTPTRLARRPNDLPKLKRWLERTARDGELRACYEASGAGDVPLRTLREWGYACDVIAPSLIPAHPQAAWRPTEARHAPASAACLPPSRVAPLVNDGEYEIPAGRTTKYTT